MSDTDNSLITQRRDKLDALRRDGVAFPNNFVPSHQAGPLHAEHDGSDKATVDALEIEVAVVGRMMSRRDMGKTTFAGLRDVTGDIQLFVNKGVAGDDVYTAFGNLDIGDILGARGVLFMTKTGELSVKLKSFQLLTKSLRPLPEKYHGLNDTETKYRQRYVDLIMNEDTRRTFRLRSQIVSYVRNFLIEREFLEVETPMMHVIPGGATAKPFITHHNVLDMPLYLRVAPELYLKRLVVGGFERVFEINRSFRNEGLSTRHNPEFTMLEFYQAYANYEDLMDTTEVLLRGLAEEVIGSTQIPNEDGTGHFDFAKPFTRLSLFDSLLQYNEQLSSADIDNLESARETAALLKVPVKESWGLGKIQMELFEATVEEKLHDPTFITLYPTEISPLSRRNDEDPSVSDRFELFIGGREMANGFSELNDAEDQAERFQAQVAEKDAGDDEAMHYDADYVRALEYGLPPTAGEGIGIDRLVMLLTASPSIRDVVLFPHMRPEKGMASLGGES